MNILKDGRVQAAIVALIVAIGAQFGIDLPQNELTEAVGSGDVGAIVVMVVGVVIGVVGGYGAKAQRDKTPDDKTVAADDKWSKLS